jgi:hypothetical protein
VRAPDESRPPDIEGDTSMKTKTPKLPKAPKMPRVKATWTTQKPYTRGTKMVTPKKHRWY